MSAVRENTGDWKSVMNTSTLPCVLYGHSGDFYFSTLELSTSCCTLANLTHFPSQRVATAPSGGRQRQRQYVGSDWSWCCRDAESDDMRGYEVCRPCQTRFILAQSLWRNGIARWTSNPEAPGSSPGRDESLCMPHGGPAVIFIRSKRWWCFGWSKMILVDSHCAFSDVSCVE